MDFYNYVCKRDSNFTKETENHMISTKTLPNPVPLGAKYSKLLQRSYSVYVCKGKALYCAKTLVLQ